MVPENENKATIRKQVKLWIGDHNISYGEVKKAFPELKANEIIAAHPNKKEAVLSMISQVWLLFNLEGKNLLYDKKLGKWEIGGIYADMIKDRFNVAYDYLSTLDKDLEGYSHKFRFDKYKDMFFEQRGNNNSMFVSDGRIYAVNPNKVEEIEKVTFKYGDEKLPLPMFHDVKFSYGYYTNISKGKINPENTKEYNFVKMIAAGRKELTISLLSLIGKTCMRSSKIGMIAILRGNGRNGKSTLLHIIKKIVGESCSANTNQSLISGSSKADVNTLYGKSTMLYEESTEAVKYSNNKLYAALKEMTGDRSEKNLDVKYRKEACRIIPPQNHIFATNLILEQPDDSSSVAFLRRHKFVEMPATFEEGQNFVYKDKEYSVENLINNEEFLTNMATIGIYYYAQSGCDVVLKGEDQKNMEKLLRGRMLLFLDRLFESNKNNNPYVQAFTKEHLFREFTHKQGYVPQSRRLEFAQFFDLLLNSSIGPNQENTTYFNEYYVEFYDVDVAFEIYQKGVKIYVVKPGQTWKKESYPEVETRTEMRYEGF